MTEANAGVRPTVLLACNRRTMEQDVTEPDLDRLRAFADFRHIELDRPTSWDEPPPPDPDTDQRLIEALGDAEALLVCHGAPRITAEILDARPTLRFVGELEGDRFARRIDVEAAWQRGVRTVDTTNGSSYGVSEWALAMTLIGLRNAGAWFRRIVIDRLPEFHSLLAGDPGFQNGELTGKTVGLIGCGIIGRRLLELLEPFRCTIYVHDPYVPRELADVFDVTFTTLDQVLANSDVVICLAPITPATRGMLGAREFGLMKDNMVFVNVSRGAIVQTDALIDVLRTGRLIACLDVFDPEPLPVDSPVRDMPNVFLTPHIAGVTAAGGPRFFRFFHIMVDELERFFGGHETRYDLLPRTIANRLGQEPPRRV
jgi:D-3-phosphoglycerate dehydrogenase